MRWQGTTGTSLVSVRSDGKISEKPQQRKDVKYTTAGRRTNTNTELASWSTKPSWALFWVAVQFLVDSSLFDSGQALSTSPSCKCMPQQQAMTITKSKHSTISCKKFWMKRHKRTSWLYKEIERKHQKTGMALAASTATPKPTQRPQTSRIRECQWPVTGKHLRPTQNIKENDMAWAKRSRSPDRLHHDEEAIPGMDQLCENKKLPKCRRRKWPWPSDDDLRVHLRKVNKQKGPRLKFNLEKLKDPNIYKTFQAMIGGKFAPLTTLKDTEEGEDLDTLTRNFSTAITDTAMEILGKHRPKKKNGSLMTSLRCVIKGEN